VNQIEVIDNSKKVNQIEIIDISKKKPSE